MKTSSPRPRPSPKRTLRRVVLALLALAAIVGPVSAPGCAASFAQISQLQGLRVLAVVADQPYAQPGDTVHFTMTYVDTYSRPPPTIAWVAGCYDPDGDEYYLCYQGLDGGLPGGLDFVQGQDLTTFSLTLPEDIISRRPKPANGPYYGIAYVFFAACSGTLELVPADSTGSAGAFPLGCFDAQHNRLGADSYVAGYTQVYAFEDGRTNHNPVVTAMTLNGDALPEGPCMESSADGGAPDGGDAGKGEKDGGAKGPPACIVSACSVPEDTRLASAGCGHTDPFKTCTAESYSIAVEVPNDVGDFDPTFPVADRTAPQKTVWVDYFADQGDFQDALLLVNDATTGLQDAGTYTTQYIAPPLDADAGGAPVTVNLWAVVHDSQGGQTVLHRELLVQ